MRTTGNQIESPVLVLNTDSLPPAGTLIRNDSINGHPLGCIIRDQTSKIWLCSLRVRQYPCAAMALYITDRAVAFLLKLLAPAFQPANQFVKPIFSLLDVARYRRVAVAALPLAY